MGRPLPGYLVRITDNDGRETKEGEITLMLGADRPAGLMQGYQGDDGALSGADGDLYRSGDVVFADDDGVLFVPAQRADEVLALAETIRDTERRQAERIREGTSLRAQVRFAEYLEQRRSTPGLTFRQHLRRVGGAIEE